MSTLGPFAINTTHTGDCLACIPQLPDEAISIVMTSPPYWGQRHGAGLGMEVDPREYIANLTQVFVALLPKLHPDSIVWINLGDAYNTPINWTPHHAWQASTLGKDQQGFDPDNVAYTKPRPKRKAYIDPSEPWLQYGNLLGLGYRLILGLCEAGYLFRGEVIWRKKNALPEGRCRRPHRHHESLYLLAKHERHMFRVSPPVPSVWEIAFDNPPQQTRSGSRHTSRFPLALPQQAIAAYGSTGREVVVLDPFAGTGTTGLAAQQAGCTYLGFEIDPVQANQANDRLAAKENPTTAPTLFD